MNFKQGMRRLALFIGVIGAILGGFVSYVELQPVLQQRSVHKQFELLAASDVVQQERKILQTPDPYASIATPIPQQSHLPKGAVLVGQDQTSSASTPPWAIWGTDVNKDGIKTIYWNDKFGVTEIETQDGQALDPTPAPRIGSYLLIATFPLLGFILPWGLIRSVAWVGDGFKG